MWKRVWIRRLGLVITASLAMLGIALGLVSMAGADLSNGAVVPGAAAAVGTVTTGTPFSSGQQINVVVPANSLFNAHTTVNVVECAAPNGVPPISPSSCDGNTIQGNSIFPNSDGSVNVQDTAGSLYSVFFLPDLSIGDTATSPPCGITASTECILYIGQNQNDFTAPHVWSQPFFIAANAGDLGDNPGDGSAPSAPTSPSAPLSTVVASPRTAVADGKDASTITVTLVGAGNVPVPGKSVVLSQGSGSSTITPANPNVSDANGKATFFVTDATAEAVTYTATDSTDDIALTEQAMVTFQPPSASAATSQVTANPSPAPGGTTTVMVTLLDQAANPKPVANQAVALSGTGSVVIAPATTGSDVTDAHGVATFTATDATAETVTFTASDTTPATPIVVNGTVVVPFGVAVSPPPPPPAPSQANSLVILSRPTDPADGHTRSLVIVTINDQYGNPVPGKSVTLQASPSGTALVSPVSVDGSTPGVTDSSGIAEFAATDTAVEIVAFSATDATDGIDLVDHPAERYVTPQAPPAATPEIAAPALLPLSALVVGGIVYGIRRKRSRRPIPMTEK